MRIRRYQEYTGSEAKWLGSVPAEWRLGRLGSHFKSRRETVSDKDFPALSVTKSGIVPQLETAAKSDDSDNRKKVVAGDFVINGRSDRKGSSGLATQDGSVSLINLVLTPRDIDPAFVHYLFRSYPFQEEFYRFGKGIVADLWSTNFSEMKGITIPLPSKQEQAAIARFLDHETIRIDTLVARQERLINLLREKRQALITRAVTKGLNPTVPMKDSGVEWLGEVPAHWEIGRLKHHIAFITSGSRGWADHYSDEGSLFIRIGNLTRDSTALDLSDVQYVDVPAGSEGERTRVKSGDLLISITAYLGSVAVVPDGIGEAYVSQHVAMARPSKNGSGASWLGYCMLSDYGRRYFDMTAYGGTKVQLSLDDVREFPVVTPPAEERAALIEWIELECRKMRAAEAKAIRLIELSKEHRSALISAAVTGKIDVRQVA